MNAKTDMASPLVVLTAGLLVALAAQGLGLLLDGDENDLAVMVLIMTVVLAVLAISVYHRADPN
ncbi:MAG: hypothetical protein IVW57_10255 [Ktedonobacterales bacterium]|nr:hypothetical protein [Ktedonobacterales bacterium]